jgi:membrane-associated phospholipid phosphatase
MICGGLAIMLFDQRFLFAFVNTNHNIIFDYTMTYVTWMGEGFFGVTIMLLLLTQKRFRNRRYFFTAVLCNAVPAILVQIIKAYYNEPRPMSVFNKAAWIHMLPQWEVLMENSFPSGHTSAAFCLFAFLSMMLTEKFSKYGFLFFLLALSVAYSRLYLAAHFFLDVYVSSMIGVGFTYLVIFLSNQQNLFSKTITSIE